MTTTPFVYGLGERVDSFLLNSSSSSEPYAMFNRDQGAARQKLNLYGSHPMYLRMNEKNSLAHGCFMFNTNAMDVILRPNYLTWQIIGGIIDIFFLIPSNQQTKQPEKVIELYTSIIGRPFLPSYHSLGRHQCRWGYKTIEETQEVVNKYAFYEIPLDTMWNDIDYMDNYLDFTTDPERFPLDEVMQFTQYLHNKGQYYVIIVDPGISNSQSGYVPYDSGLEQNVFFLDYTKSQPIQGRVWPGITVFPDFYSPNASDWWNSQVTTFYNSGVFFDGLWADMSEPSSYCSGTCPLTPVTLPPDGDKYDNPPFNPLNAPLNTSTMSMSAQGYLGVQYNAHNLFGYAETKITFEVLKNLLNTRPFVLPRSTWISSGYYGAHWLGDNFSSWEYLKNSIAGVLSFQLFGIPMVGVDICGFHDETTPELCSRWEQLGAFYPFNRNHNSRHMKSQEPYALTEQHLIITKNSLHLRYLFLPYYYSLFFNSHRFGSCVWLPLFFKFPTDINCYSIEYQFLVGDSVLISPVLDEGESSVNAYFPAGIWYDFYSGSMESNNSINGTWIELDAPLDKINIHLYGGSIIPLQTSALTTSESRKNPFDLLVQLSESNSANGFLIIDDGTSLDTFENKLYTEIEFDVSFNQANNTYTFSSVVILNGYDSSYLKLGSIRVSGVTSNPKTVTVNGRSISTYSFDKSTSVLNISGILVTITDDITVTW